VQVWEGRSVGRWCIISLQWSNVLLSKRHLYLGLGWPELELRGYYFKVLSIIVEIRFL
jgi:hypothetical protein